MLRQEKSSKQQEYVVILDELRLVYGCMLERAFPYLILTSPQQQVVQFAKSYEGAAQWVKRSNGIIKMEDKSNAGKIERKTKRQQQH